MFDQYGEAFVTQWNKNTSEGAFLTAYESVHQWDDYQHYKTIDYFKYYYK